jgi:hypothetical protein
VAQHYLRVAGVCGHTEETGLFCGRKETILFYLNPVFKEIVLLVQGVKIELFLEILSCMLAH